MSRPITTKAVLEDQVRALSEREIKRSAELQELTLRIARAEDLVLAERKTVQEIHQRAQVAELERANALSRIEQLVRDNVLLCTAIEDLRAKREVQLQALQDLVDAVAGMGIAGEGASTALTEARQVLLDARGGR